MSAQTHTADARILNRRTLRRDHPTLAKLVCPGMSVLDVGCGSGAITGDIARAVGASGRVVGLDRDDALLALAREQSRNLPQVEFVNGDVLSVDLDSQFDIVTAARVLQWIDGPDIAVERMAHAVVPGGNVVVLDYNHENNTWEPEPPTEFTRFYKAFLDWRSANLWDNLMAEHLPGMFIAAGLDQVNVHIDDDVVVRGDESFEPMSRLWLEVIETLGPKLIGAGYASQSECTTAHEVYADWIATGLKRQRLEIRTVVGQKDRRKS